MLKEKIYIAGCGGMLGEAFYKVFSTKYKLKCTDIDVNEKWLTYLDFRNYKKYYNDVNNFKADYLFHLGAYTDLEYCEKNKKKTYLTNVISVNNAIKISNKLKIPLIYISTAGIFDGKKRCYNDLDTPKPLSQYGISKYLGEIYVQKNCHKYLICRAGWMMGGGPKKDKKFIQKIMLKIKNGANELFIANDKLGTPTYTHDFAKNLKLLLEKKRWGLYNMVCNGATSRLSVARELCKIINLKKKIKINEVVSNYWKKIYFAKRPYSERLINKKLNMEKLNIMRNWKICLKEYVNNYYKNYIK
jgi:dTDP-4-dehydrorhamnose reductase